MAINKNIFIGNAVFGRQMSCLTGFILTQGLGCSKKHNCEPISIEGTWKLKINHMRTSEDTQSLISLTKCQVTHSVCFNIEITEPFLFVWAIEIIMINLKLTDM